MRISTNPWQICYKKGVPILNITCASMRLYWRLVQSLEAMSQVLGSSLSSQARIRVYSRFCLGIPFEIRVKEWVDG